MKKINIEELKNKIKAKTGITIVFGALLLTLMGCGKTNQDTQVTTGPDTTVETTIDDPEVDVPVVEPVTDVSGNDAEPVEENEFPEPTFVLTGDNQYTVYVNCADNSNADELQTVMNGQNYIENTSNFYGVSQNLLYAFMASGAKKGTDNLFQIDFDAYKDKEFSAYHFYGNFEMPVVFTDTPDSYPGNVLIATREDLSNGSSIYEGACAVIINNAFSLTNFNMTLAIEYVLIGPDNFYKMMDECKDATGLSYEEICASYDLDFVASYDTLGLANVEGVYEILSYIPNDDPVTITQMGSNGEPVVTTINIAKEKTLTLN